ncbi:cell division protein FtsL [Flaviflagellibacter deserti]|uniref:Cell division protein FtsL n=1 Tax=Flaviflagellibacter deserti TaxID=2267266 RepID=A0ABV9Z5X4_9HYPH
MKIARFFNVIAVIALIAAAVVVYQIKYRATWQAEEVAKLERQINREKAAIAVLEAEWAHLVRPDRIQLLASKNLDLKAADPRQRIEIAALPLRPARVDSIAATIESLGLEQQPLLPEPKAPGEDPIARTIEAMGLALPSGQDRVDRVMNSLGIGQSPPPRHGVPQ